MLWDEGMSGDLFDEPYYAAASAPPRLRESETETRLRRVLSNDARDSVLQAVARWNQTLRQEVRAVTGLRLGEEHGGGRTNVPVIVADGIPAPLADAAEGVESWQWWLALHRPELEQGVYGLDLVTESASMLAQRLGNISDGLAGVDAAQALIKRIMAHSIEKDILDRFRDIQDDIMGAYWFNASKIQLYWMPLAIFAPILRVRLEHLTAVVLCHELVHAYTHRGADIDGESWNTIRFMQTDVYVKEGLAQFYTQRVMESLKLRFPEGREVFDEKTKRQSPPYTAYRNWLGQGKQPSPEAVRLAMLQFRNARQTMTRHEEFVTLLHTAHKQLRGRTE